MHLRPECSVTISPELTRLLRPSAPSEFRDRPPDRAMPSPQDPDIPWPMVQLRVDGRRPRRFRGIHVCDLPSAGICAHAGRQVRIARTVRFYLADDGTVVAQSVGTPDADIVARPVHRCATLTSPDDLRALVEASDRACLDLLAGVPGPVRQMNP